MPDNRRSERARTAQQESQRLFARGLSFFHAQVKHLPAPGRIDIRYAPQNGIDPALINGVFFGVRLLGHPDALRRKKRLRFGAGLSAGAMVIPVRHLRHIRKAPHETRKPLRCGKARTRKAARKTAPRPLAGNGSGRSSPRLTGSSRRRRERETPCPAGFSGAVPRREIPCPPPPRCSLGSRCCGAGVRGKARGRET